MSIDKPIHRRPLGRAFDHFDLLLRGEITSAEYVRRIREDNRKAIEERPRRAAPKGEQ